MTRTYYRLQCLVPSAFMFGDDELEPHAFVSGWDARIMNGAFRADLVTGRDVMPGADSNVRISFERGWDAADTVCRKLIRDDDDETKERQG